VTAVDRLDKTERRYRHAKRVFYVILSLGILVALVLATFALNEVSSKVGCLNSVLATRQKASNDDANAQASAINAVNDFVHALNTAILLPSGSAAKAAASAQFEKVSADTAKILTTSSRIVSADAAYRSAHPLGRC
jgi:hypothetical protein